MRLRFFFLAVVASSLLACSGAEDRAAAVDPNANRKDGGTDTTTEEDTEGEDTSVEGDSGDATVVDSTLVDGADSSIADTAATDTATLDAAKTDSSVGDGFMGIDTALLADAPFDIPGDADAAMFLTCVDKVKSGDETDVDCGGSCRLVSKCDVGKNCLVDGDCVQGKCGTTTKQCSEPSCTDGVANGTETDTDCGGPSCGKCGNDKRCKFSTDCVSNVCGAGGVCAAPTCTDGVKNGSESDIDCGGGCAKKCLIGATCNGAGDCASSTCLATCQCPPGMKQLNVPTGSGTYCIDQAEVTNTDYASFLTSGFADPTTQDPTLCKDWNASFVPTSSWPAPPTAAGNPVRGVDWCDALAYCKAKGKVLCGKIGGGATPVASFADEKVSKWMNACSQGVNPYPYGSTYQPIACNGSDYWKTIDGGVPNTWPVANGPAYLNLSCYGGPASNVFQLSGNVAEWEDSCETSTTDAGAGAGASDNCLVRGGSFLSNAAEMQCGAKRAVPRNTRADDIGFRCCL